MARHIPFRPHGVTDLSHSRRRPAPVDSCLDEVFRDAIGGQMLMDFPQIGKNDVGWCRKSSSWLNIQNTKCSTINTIGYNWWILLGRKVRDRKSRSPSLDQRLLRFFGPWVLERKPYCDWRDTQWLKLDSFSRFVNLYYQLSFSLLSHYIKKIYVIYIILYYISYIMLCISALPVYHIIGSSYSNPIHYLFP